MHRLPINKNNNMTFNPDASQRHSIRLHQFDYAQAGAYFITICTYHRQCLLGEAVDSEIKLNTFGQIAHDCWQQIPAHFPFVIPDMFVVMPNHVHGIINIADVNRRGIACYAPTQGNSNRFGGVAPCSISTIVRSYKSAVTRGINGLRQSPGAPLWQRNYYEHVIRDEDDLAFIREYIRFNPQKWLEDDENLARISPFANPLHNP